VHSTRSARGVHRSISVNDDRITSYVMRSGRCDAPPAVGGLTDVPATRYVLSTFSMPSPSSHPPGFHHQTFIFILLTAGTPFAMMPEKELPMARIVLGSVVASISGSVAGCTYSRNRYGPYVRNRSNPVNPNSPEQVNVRAAFANLNEAWNIDLDEAEREAWNSYALGTFGPTGMTGQNAFVAINANRIRWGIVRIDIAPANQNLTELSALTIGTMVPATSVVPIAFAPTDEWAADDDGYLFLTFARPVNESINFFKGPFRGGVFATSVILGNTAVPPTSPFAAVSPFAFVTGQRVFVRAIASAPDGRLSVPQIFSAVSP
jgi:hypothetical protein